MASLLSRRACRAVLTNSRTKPSGFVKPFCTKSLSSSETSSDSDDTTAFDSNLPLDSNLPESKSFAHSSSSTQFTQQPIYDRPLEKGLDTGIYKAILVGKVGQKPVQKKLKGGQTVTFLSVGTGGIRNNRRPLDNEEPKEYANRCAVQWHRVSIYPERLGAAAMKQIVLGSILYLEGNLETKIFTDTITGLVRRIREIAIRRNGRVVFLGNGNDTQQTTQTEIKGVGYY